MRTHNVKIGERTIECATNFKAMMAITERVMDPMMIARDEALFAAAQAAGKSYEPKFQMTVLNLTKLLHAGQEAAGGKLTLDEMGDIVMEAGPAMVVQEVGEYIAALVAGDSQELPKTKAGKKGGTKGNG